MNKKVPCLICDKLKEVDNEKVIATVCDDCCDIPKINKFLNKLDYKQLKSILEKAERPEHLCVEVNEYGEIL